MLKDTALIAVGAVVGMQRRAEPCNWRCDFALFSGATCIFLPRHT